MNIGETGRCAWCGKPFVATSHKQRYGSSECMIMAVNQLKALIDEENASLERRRRKQVDKSFAAIDVFIEQKQKELGRTVYYGEAVAMMGSRKSIKGA